MPAAQDDLRVDTAIGPLLLRRPGAGDLPAVWAVHGDPRTNRHNPAGPDADVAASRDRLREWLDHWERHGFGYSAVEAADGRVVGFSGVRTSAWDGAPVLNLYYRYAPEVWGRGVATAVARAVVADARRRQPDVPVLAFTTVDNTGSRRTALAAGLVRRPDLERVIDGHWAVVFTTPPSG
ncbi:GNAT family N-acetyltransferase [Geodermatophilus nigrescens]